MASGARENVSFNETSIADNDVQQFHVCHSYYPGKN